MLKTRTKYSIIIATLLIALLASVVTAALQTRVMAATGSIYLTPSQTAVVNNNLTVNLRINPGTAVTVVQATVVFDPGKLQYVSVNASSSPFDASVQQTASGSTIQISRAKLDANGISSDSLIASITFKALASSGSSAVSLSNANAAFEGAYTNPGATGATVTFSPGACPSGQTGTPPNCQTPVTPTQPTTPTTPSTPKPTTTTPTTTKPATATPTTTPTTTKPVTTPGKPVVSEPKIIKQEAAFTKVVIEASTEQDARVLVRYGASKDSLNIQTPLTASGKTHSITLDQGLTPGMSLFYTVVAQGAQGATAQTQVQSVQTKGLSVKLALFGENLEPLRNQEVTLEPLGITAKTDRAGFVVLESLPPGDFTVALTYDGIKYAQHLGVASNVDDTDGAQTSAVLSAAIVYAGLQAKPASVLSYWPIALVVLVVAGAVVLFVLRPQWLKNVLNRIPFLKKQNVPTAYPEIVAFGSANSVVIDQPVIPQPVVTPQETFGSAAPTTPTTAAPSDAVATSSAPYEPAPWERPPQQKGPF